MSVSSGIFDLLRAQAICHELGGRWVVTVTCVCKPALRDSLKSGMRIVWFLWYLRLPAVAARYTVR